jgi:hypothetical protein
MKRDVLTTALWVTLALLVLALCAHRPEPASNPLVVPTRSSPSGGQPNPFTPETWG